MLSETGRVERMMNMKTNDNDKISPRQYTTLIIATIIGAGVLAMPRGVVEKAGSDGWLVTIAGGLAVLLATCMLNKLALMFPRDTFVTFSQQIVGKWLGLMLSITFVVYFFLVAVYEVRLVGDISNVFLLDNTPMQAVMFFYLWLTIMGARGGIEGMVRICQLLAPIIIIVVIFIGFLVFPQLDLSKLQPVLHTPPQTLTRAIFTTSLSYLGFEMILFLVPSLAKPQDAIKNAALGVSIVIGLYTFIVVVSLALFGATDIKKITWSMITAVKMIDFPGAVFDRLESIFLSVWVMAAFTTSIVYTYFAVQATALIAGFREFKPVLYFIMPFIYGLALVPEHVETTSAFGSNLGKYGFILVTVVPLILLMIARLRKKGETNEFQAKR